MADFLPRSDADLVVWFNNFQLKLLTYASAFGLVAGDTTAVTADYTAFAYMVNQIELSKQNTQDRVSYKDLIKVGPIGATGVGFPGTFTPPTVPTTVVLPGAVPRIRILVKRLKAHAAYTNSIGEDLGIVGAAGGGGTPKPTGSALAIAGSGVQVKFKKAGFDGVLLESMRGAETAWSNLGIFVRSPINDTRAPLVAGAPEVRSYRMRYVIGNSPTGDVSDTLTVTTRP